jgi:hypothetical protein
MGVDRWAYLGPYLELPLTLKTTERDMCPQPAQCPNPDPNTSPFCATCGMQVAKRFHQFQSADPPIPDFLFRELNDALATADGMMGPTRVDHEHVIYRLIGNARRPNPPREFYLDDNSDVWMDLTSVDTQAEIKWFKEAYTPELMKVADAYGGMMFKWGFLQWFS